MRDHINGSARAKPTRVRRPCSRIEDACGACIVCQARDSRALTNSTHRGRAVGAYLPLDPADDTSQAPDAAEAAAHGIRSCAWTPLFSTAVSAEE